MGAGNWARRSRLEGGALPPKRSPSCGAAGHRNLAGGRKLAAGEGVGQGTGSALSPLPR